MSATANSVLVVDDDQVFRERLVEAFVRRGFDARGAQNTEHAVQLAQQDSPEFALVDLKMPGASGLQAVRALHELDATTRIVMLTAYGSIATAVEAMKLGAHNYLTKPADLDQILAAFGAGNDAIEQTVAHASLPSLARVEWEHIQRTLTKYGGNVTQAAKALGLHRRSLQRKLEKYPAPR